MQSGAYIQRAVKLNDTIAEGRKSKVFVVKHGVVRIDKSRAWSEIEVQRIISHKVKYVRRQT